MKYFREPKLAQLLLYSDLPSYSFGYVLKPKTTKRNERNDQNENIETTKTKPPKRPKRNRQNQRNHRNEQRGIRSLQIADSTHRAGLSIIYFFFGEIFISRNTKEDRVLSLLPCLGFKSWETFWSSANAGSTIENLNYRNQNFTFESSTNDPNEQCYDLRLPIQFFVCSRTRRFGFS